MGEDDVIGTGVTCARPQPVGVFPLPAGFLLVPGGEATADLRRTLAAGKVPAAWPAELAALELAYRGEVVAAVGQLRGDDPVDRYNRFVLRPAGADPEDPVALRRALGDELGILVDVVRFALGELDEPPPPGGETGEIAAMVWSAHAAQAMAAGRPGEAAGLLERAIAAAREPSPGLATQLRSTAADLRRGVEGPSPAVIAELTAALAALAATDLTVGRAELHLSLGSAYQELAGNDPASLKAAVEHYLSALRLVRIDTAPELFAAAQVNLATAYLAMPMAQASDQLRVGVAVQGLRTALSVYTRETHPERWASTQLNLANALVYAPSAHREDNLREAVARYQDVIAARDRDADPLGYARARANQGNALAHLGLFDPAQAVLHEARAIFEEFGDSDAVLAVRGVLDEIARRLTAKST
ncbi:hypothetical protein [Frankia sp. CcWB3]